MIVLLAARALGYQGSAHIDLAAIVEFIHTATLLHDDVVDDSNSGATATPPTRVGKRGQRAGGRLPHSRAFEMMVAVDSMRVMEVLSHATNRIAEGEVLQLLNCNDPDTDEQRYREVILRKTATLFEAGAPRRHHQRRGQRHRRGARRLRPAPGHGVPDDRRRTGLWLIGGRHR